MRSTHEVKARQQPIVIAILLIAVIASLIVGFYTAQTPMLLGAIGFALVGTYCLSQHFEFTVLALLIVRSSLDIFSNVGIPALFSIGIIFLMLFYICWKIIAHQEIQTDNFFWLLVAWVAVNSLWVILLPLGGLGLGSSMLSGAVREWARLLAWAIVYLMVLQLRGKIHPMKLANLMFLSLVVPLSAAALQILLPESLLPNFLSLVEAYSEVESASRINGTFGHPNAFATFLVLFVGLTCWRFEHARRSWPWLLLLSLLIFFVVSTKALVGLPMVAIVVLLFFASKLTPSKLIGSGLLILATIFLFASSEFGRERIASLMETPLLNPDIDISRAILMRYYIDNSFNWRLAQWTALLDVWKDSPVLGFGLSSVPRLTVLQNSAHNDYIRALIEGGIVGLIVYLFFLLANFARLLSAYLVLPKDSPQRDLCLALLAVFVAMVVGMLTENIFSHTVLFFYWLALSSLITWDWRPDNDQQIFT